MTINAVEEHYSKGGLLERILAALDAAGKDARALSPDDLAAVDEFHGGQRPATIRLAKLLAPCGKERVLDVGSGIGGPARFLASAYGCRVTGVDLCGEFCRVAETLTGLTGLQELVDFRQADALDLPFAEASFDIVWSQNSAMNIAERDRLYREMRRVLRAGGKLALQEIALGPGGEPHYPVAWAREPAISFLLTPEETRNKLEAARFGIVLWQDTSAATLASARARSPQKTGSPGAPARSPATPPALGTHLILGDDWQEMARNSVRNLEEGRVALFNAVLEALP